MSRASRSKEPVEIFISYAHEDENLRKELEKHLSILTRRKMIIGWQDRKIIPGHNWKKEIDEKLNTAKVILLLVSADFLASDYCYGIEMKKALQRDKVKEARVIPVILRDVYWRGAPFGKLQALPTDGKAVTSWGNPDSAFKIVAEGIVKVIEEIRAKPPAGAPQSTGTKSSGRGKVSGQPGIWNVPHRRNPNFTGREELLAELREELTSGKHAALTQAIYGLGGVGKTQLATEYAYRHAGEYDVVWWVRSEEAATLAADYAALAGRLGLPEKDAREQEVVVEAVRGWLEGKQRWLLVFDNANGPEEVNRYLPGVVKGHVIITSRNPNWGEIASPLQVKVLEPDKGAEFLLHRTRQEDEASARTLSEELGGLPLALAQAGAYIEANGVTIEHYLELFQLRREDLWAGEQGPLDYDKRTVSITLSLAIKQVETKAPASMDLLHLCAFLGPDDIPRSMLSGGKEYLPEQLGETVADELKMNKAIEALRHYSLVEVDMDRTSLSVHRLVQAVVRDGLGGDERKVWAEAAVDVVDEAFPSESYDVRTWGECARLLPHGLAATGHVEELGIASGRAGRLLNHVGNYLWGRAQYTEAKTVLQRSVPIMSKVHGEEHSAYATTLNNLGMVLQDMGDLVGAKEHYERALAIDEQAFGPLHPNVARDVNNLGSVLQDMGDLQGAKEHLERAFRISRQFLGDEHPYTVGVGRNLLVVMLLLGEEASGEE
ncbi:MAG TPA: FxSxx-COOH system tetratricopeptide repeat protein [Chloroflexia bacterium]|nr:FxSxx-COOH system tetratricopeptide repeat protein [Chloroflexia bacterium]